MEALWVINGEKLTLDFPIVGFPVLIYLMLFIKLMYQRLQSLCSSAETSMAPLEESLMLNLMQLMYFAA